MVGTSGTMTAVSHRRINSCGGRGGHCRRAAAGDFRGWTGFTLIELLVVVSLIAALAVLALPGISGLISTNDMAQAENMVRATLFSARTHAVQRSAMAGVRFQDDGYMILAAAANMRAAYTPDTFTAEPVYEMRAVAGIPATRLPGTCRLADPTCMALFSSHGRTMQANCVFPPDWYPTTAGSFGRWTGTVGADGRSYTGVCYGNAGGPPVKNEFWIRDAGGAVTMMKLDPNTGQASRYRPGQ
jgi:prepilin-type N-terminal cleavage/methylation domain-containing protein